MRTIKTWLATIAVLLCSITANAHDFVVDGICYSITSNTTVSVTYRGNYSNSYSNEYSGNVVIPSTVRYSGKEYSVTSIGSSAFYDCSSLTSVTIPNSVTSIGSSAFYACSSLRKVLNFSKFNISKGSSDYGYVGYYASLVLNNPEIIDNYVFAPNGNTYALYGYMGTDTNLQLPEKYKGENYVIGDFAFYGCSGLTSVTIPNSVTSIGNEAFRYCYVLTSVTIPNSVTSIGGKAFRACSGLTSVTIPNSVTSIGDEAFYDCDGLTSVTIGNSVTSIGNYAFSSCSGLTSVTIGNSVTSIGYEAFYYCSSLKKVLNFSKLNIGKGSIFNGYVGYYADLVVNNAELIDNYVFAPYGDTYALYGYVGADLNLQLPEKYKGENYIIGDYAFYKCSGLTSVTIPNSVTSIGNWAFGGCSNLKNLIIGSGVLFIGSNQSKPTKVIWLTNTPPSGYTNLAGTINYVANDNYTQLSNKKVYKYLSSQFEVDGIIYVPVNPSARTCDAISCSYDNTATSINIGETVSYKGIAMSVENVMPYTAYGQTTVKTVNLSPKYDIGDYAFYGCNNLSSITLGDSIKSIGNYAFYGCSKLTEVTIPNKTTSLGEYCFSGNSLLANVDLGNGLRTIGQYCFSGCSLPEISIPASVTSIGNYAFNNCTSLADVVIEDRNTELNLGSNGSSPLFASCPLDSVYIGGKIKYNTSSSSGYSPFYRNTSLRTIVITDEEEEIYNNEFYGCTNLKNVTMGDGVKKIGNWAFSGCCNLDYFNFGSGMQSIGDEAFSDCTNLTMLISYAEVPPTCGSMALDDINKWECVLQVPENCQSAYQSANQWKEFFFIEDVLTGINDVKTENGLVKTEIFDLSGRRVQNVAKGIYIQNGKKVFIK